MLPSRYVDPHTEKLNLLVSSWLLQVVAICYDAGVRTEILTLSGAMKQMQAFLMVQTVNFIFSFSTDDNIHWNLLILGWTGVQSPQQEIGQYWCLPNGKGNFHLDVSGGKHSSSLSPYSIEVLFINGSLWKGRPFANWRKGEHQLPLYQWRAHSERANTFQGYFYRKICVADMLK